MISVQSSLIWICLRQDSGYIEISITMGLSQNGIHPTSKSIKIWGTSMPLPRDLDAEQGTLKQKWEATAPQTAKSCRTQSEIIRGRRLLFSLWEQKEILSRPQVAFLSIYSGKKKSSNSWIIQMVYSRLLVGLVQSENQMFLVTGLEVRSLGMTPPRSQEPWRPN